MRRRRRVWTAALLALMVGVAGCSGDSGPGEIQGRIEASGATLGAAVFEVTLPGIRGVEGSGSTRVVAHAVEGRDAYRVVAVNPDGGGLRFRILADDAGRPLAGSIIFQASDTANELVGPGVGLELVVDG